MWKLPQTPTLFELSLSEVFFVSHRLVVQTNGCLCMVSEQPAPGASTPVEQAATHTHTHDTQLFLGALFCCLFL